MTDRRPIVYRDAVHQPLDANDRLDVPSIPVQLAPNNHQLIQTPDIGLYVGPLLNGRSAFYVADSGTDDPLAGDKATPFKTLDYALARIQAMSNGEYKSGIVIALKAGETFTMNDNFACYNALTIAFWGDPQYGDWDSPAINGSATPGLMADLSRPVINVGIAPNTSGGIASFIMFGGQYNNHLRLTLWGVKVNLPGGPHATGAVDFITGVEWSTSSVKLYGAIVNMTDPTAEFGLYGLEAWCKGSLYQFGSKLTIGDQEVGPGSSPDVLLARKNFIKFYPDFAGNIQTGLQLHGGSPGSALMELSWSDVPSLPVAPGKINQATYPVLFDPAFGLGNYFFNLVRNSQGLPQNVWSGRPF